jgi:hypothetical protein
VTDQVVPAGKQWKVAVNPFSFEIDGTPNATGLHGVGEGVGLDFGIGLGAWVGVAIGLAPG